MPTDRRMTVPLEKPKSSNGCGQPNYDNDDGDDNDDDNDDDDDRWMPPATTYPWPRIPAVFETSDFQKNIISTK